MNLLSDFANVCYRRPLAAGSFNAVEKCLWLVHVCAISDNNNNSACKTGENVTLNSILVMANVLKEKDILRIKGFSAS